MSSKEKLQHLFDAALRSPEEPSAKSPRRAFPNPSLDAPTADPSTEATPAPSASVEASAATTEPVTEDKGLLYNPPSLDKEAAEELGKLLDEQVVRRRKKRRRELVVLLVLFLGTTGGGTGWFVSNPDRVQALKDAIRDIRTVTDVKTLVSKFQDALDRISVRGNQIDQATAALGVTANAKDMEDAYMDKEMKEMMGGEEGRTVGERNRMLQQSFGNRAKEAGGAPKANLAKLKEFQKENAFEWDK